MRTDERPQFAAILAGLGETYDKKITKALADIYFLVLGDFSCEEVQAAARAHMRDPKAGAFWPKPADLIRWIPSTTASLDPAESAEIAWHCVLDAIGRIGPYRPLELDDPVAIACVRSLGGWQKICAQTHEQLVWIRKEFLTSYEIYARHPVELLPASLPGLCDLKKRERLGAHSSSTEVVRA